MTHIKSLSQRILEAVAFDEEAAIAEFEDNPNKWDMPYGIGVRGGGLGYFEVKAARWQSEKDRAVIEKLAICADFLKQAGRTHMPPNENVSESFADGYAAALEDIKEWAAKPVQDLENFLKEREGKSGSK